jgi:phospholipid/cholesterol/gamma-HCH transport system substrate-binding protein
MKGRPDDAVRLPGTSSYVSRRIVALLGVVMLLIPIGTVALVVASFTGAFGSYVTVDAELPLGANAPQLDSPVEYRDVTVGDVASSGMTVGQKVIVVLHLQPSEIDVIPSGVRATVAPLSIFGNQYVDLEPPANLGSAHVVAGQLIQAITVSNPSSLQDTLADLDDVLNSIHASQLDQILTSIATALSNQGSTLGTTFNHASAYLAKMLPLLPTFESDLGLISPVANQLASSTKSLLAVLSNLSVTSKTVVGEAGQLHDVLVGGASVAGQATSVLTTIAQPWEQLVAASGPLLQDVSQSPTEIADVLEGLNSWSKAWSAAESSGPYLSLTATVSVPNAADLVVAQLGANDPAALFADGIGNDLVNPQTYTAADCPTYDASGSNCDPSDGTAGGNLSDASTAAMVNVGTLLEPQQERAVATIAAGWDHGKVPSSPAVATLLLGPVLGQIAGERR